MAETPKCQLCGEPMPPGEEMFNFHGYSGPCPKPPLPRKRSMADAVEEVEQLLQETLQNASVNNKDWLVTRVMKIQNALADRQK